MGEARETLSPFVILRIYLIDRRFNYDGWKAECWRQIRRTCHPKQLLRRLWWEDTFGPLVCWFLKHRPYNTLANDPPEWACRRCHRWLPKASHEGSET